MQRETQDLDDLKYTYVHGFQRERYPDRGYLGDGFWYGPDQVKPWCVRRAFAGHYFLTVQEALKYAAQRKFISLDMVDIIRIRLEDRGIIER